MQLARGGDSERSGPAEQFVKYFGGGAGIVESAMGRHVAHAKQLSQGAQGDRRRFVASEQFACQPYGADGHGIGPGDVVGGGGRGQESKVELGVVCDEDGAARELQERGQGFADLCGAVDHVLGDTGEFHNLGRDGLLGIDHGRHLVDDDAGVMPHCPDFDDGVAGGIFAAVSRSTMTNVAVSSESWAGPVVRVVSTVSINSVLNRLASRSVSDCDDVVVSGDILEAVGRFGIKRG